MPTDTKTSILDAAEALFAEHGFDATSLRGITARAEVNLAAVNYHFGSKDALIEALLERRLVPMNAERVKRLEGLERRYRGGQIPLEALVDAFTGPPLELSRDAANGGARFVRLLGRAYTQPGPAIHQTLRGTYVPVIERFKTAFARALPELPPGELYWRLHFMVGLLAYVMAGADMMRLIASSRLGDSTDGEAVKWRLVDFLTAGMRAPHAGARTRSAVAELHG